MQLDAESKIRKLIITNTTYKMDPHLIGSVVSDYEYSDEAGVFNSPGVAGHNFF